MQHAVDVGVGVQEDDRHAEQNGEDGRGRRIFEARGDARGLGGHGDGGHRHTFSISGRPSRPEGMKMRVIARIENAATSL